MTDPIIVCNTCDYAGVELLEVFPEERKEEYASENAQRIRDVFGNLVGMSRKQFKLVCPQCYSTWECQEIPILQGPVVLSINREEK